MPATTNNADESCMQTSRNTLPGLMSRSEAGLRAVFLEQVKNIPAGERIKRCIQCGTCTGSCPVSYAMDVSPRQLIALFRVGEMERVMQSRTIWICASCYACTTRCPMGIKITDIIYALKRAAMERGVKSAAPQVQRLAKLFVRNLMRYGRLHEGMLIAGYTTRTNPLKFPGFLPLARKMWKTRRIAVFPHKIRAHASLARIIRRAQEIDLRNTQEKPEFAPEYVGYRGLGELQLEQRKGDRP
jgi:heterodisulfide reductase subunit C